MRSRKKSSIFGKVPVQEKAAYAIASGGGNIITTLLGSFLSGYLTDSVGVAAAAVGTMMLVARFFDAFSDVCMERSLTRHIRDGGRPDPGF